MYLKIAITSTRWVTSTTSSTSPMNSPRKFSLTINAKILCDPLKISLMSSRSRKRIDWTQHLLTLRLLWTHGTGWLLSLIYCKTTVLLSEGWAVTILSRAPSRPSSSTTPPSRTFTVSSYLPYSTTSQRCTTSWWSSSTPAKTRSLSSSVSTSTTKQRKYILKNCNSPMSTWWARRKWSNTCTAIAYHQ